jgi:hypothetical protein
VPSLLNGIDKSNLQAISMDTESSWSLNLRTASLRDKYLRQEGICSQYERNQRVPCQADEMRDAVRPTEDEYTLKTSRREIDYSGFLNTA